MDSSTTMTRRLRLTTMLLPWTIWGVSSLFVSFQMLLQTAPSVMINDLQQAFSIDTLGVSLLSTSFFYAYVLLQIPAGMLIDRVQPRYCLTACFIGVSLLTMVFAYAPTLGIARVGRVFQGAFSAPSIVPALYLAATWFPAKYFAMLAGMTEMMGITGSAIGQVILAPSSSYWGWRNTLLICAMVGILMAIVTWIVVRNKPEVIEKNRLSEPLQKAPILQSLLLIISCPQAWLSGLFSGLLFAVAAAFASLWCIPFLMKLYPISLNTAAAASSMILFGVSLGAPLLGSLSDRLGVRRWPMVVCTTMDLLLMLVVIYMPNIHLEEMFVLLFILGFFSSIYALPFAVVRDIMPTHVRGTAMGFTNMLSISIGAPILQPFIGWLLQKEMTHTTNQVLAYQHALVILPVSLGVGLLMTFFIRETYCGNKS